MNRGAFELNKLIEGSQSQAARVLDVDQSYLNRVARSERVPGLEIRKKLKEHYGIPLEAWDEEAEEDPIPDTERPS